MGDADVAALIVGRLPASFKWHKEIVLVSVSKLFLDQVRLHALVLVLGPQLLSILLELVAQAFEEQHSEYVLLVFRGIHVAPQDVARLEEFSLQPGQGQLRRFLLGRGCRDQGAIGRLSVLLHRASPLRCEPLCFAFVEKPLNQFIPASRQDVAYLLDVLLSQ